MSITIFLILGLATIGATVGDRLDNSLIDPPRVAAVDEMSEVHVYHTYKFLKYASQDESPSSDIKARILNAENAIQEDIKLKCGEFLAYPAGDVEKTVHYWFDQLDKHEAYKAKRQREALVGLSVEVLNAMESAERIEIITTTPESVMSSDPKVWLSDQKWLCTRDLTN